MIHRPEDGVRRGDQGGPLPSERQEGQGQKVLHPLSAPPRPARRRGQRCPPVDPYLWRVSQRSPGCLVLVTCCGERLSGGGGRVGRWERWCVRVR
eukprot:2019559-Prymnesium_polylepis.1